MSWGKGITVALVLFVALIGTLVYMSTQQHFSLVSESYYEDSLEYDKVQNKKSNYAALDGEVVVDVDNDVDAISIVLPSGFEGDDVRGKVHLYNPTDSRYDKHFELVQPFTESTDDLKKGKWTVKVDFEKDGKSYLFERTVFLN